MDYEEELSRRKKIDESLFFIDKEVVQSRAMMSIVMRCGHYGLQHGTEDLLPTVFDLIRFVTDSVVEIQINGSSGLFSANNGDWLFEPSQYHLRLLDDLNVIEVEGEDGKGLFSLREKLMVVPPKYDDTTNTDIGEYLWVRKGDRFHFILKGNHVFHSASDAIMAYDTDDGMWVKHSDGTVALLNKVGNDDTRNYRKTLIKNGGRMKLQNLKYGIIDICDIYGHILN